MGAGACFGVSFLPCRIFSSSAPDGEHVPIAALSGVDLYFSTVDSLFHSFASRTTPSKESGSDFCASTIKWNPRFSMPFKMPEKHSFKSLSSRSLCFIP
ncbi:hypothetical protein D3C77_697950 [compost metagenome]